MVQERFLECLEAPAVDDYTKSYQVSEKHTYRPSPLAVVCLEKNVVVNPVYLAVIGGDLPFHDKNRLDQYEAAISKFIDVLDDGQLSRDAIEMLSDTHAARVTAAYLRDAYRHELPSENLAAHKPEIAAIEQRLGQLVDKLPHENNEVPSRRKNPNADSLQPYLFSGLGQEGRGNSEQPKVLPIPQLLHSVRIGKSELAALIYWALVYLRLDSVTFFL